MVDTGLVVVYIEHVVSRHGLIGRQAVVAANKGLQVDSASYGGESSA